MTHAYTAVSERRDGHRHILVGDLAVSSLGSSTGEALVAATDFGVGTIEVISVAGPTDSDPPYLARYDATSGKMRYFAPGAAGQTVTELLSDQLAGYNASATDFGTSEPTNGHAVMAVSDANAVTAGALAHAAGKTLAVTFATPRNVLLVLPAGTYAGGNLVLTGTRLGVAATDTIAVPAATVASTHYRTVAGVTVFDALTNATLSAAQGASATISLGYGSILGLPRKAASITAVRSGNAAVASGTYVFSATQHSVDMGADVAASDDIVIEYVAKGTEAAATTNVGSVRVRVEGY